MIDLVSEQEMFRGHPSLQAAAELDSKLTASSQSCKIRAVNIECTNNCLNLLSYLLYPISGDEQADMLFSGKK